MILHTIVVIHQMDMTVEDAGSIGLRANADFWRKTMTETVMTKAEMINILSALLDARETMIRNTYSDEKVREHARQFGSVRVECAPVVFRAIETAIGILSNESGQSDTA